MDIKIGPYRISQRTSYSKIMVTDDKTGENISKEEDSKIMQEYEKQKKNINKYFNISANSVHGLSDEAKGNELEYLFIPESITKIGDFAFEMESIKYIGFPSTLKEIGESAFYYCDMLDCVDIPDSVEIIEKNAFDSCYALTTVRLPSSIRRIEDDVFCQCDMLKEITLPDTVSEIGMSAFYDCDNLKSIHLPKNLKMIEDCAFKGCKSLEEIVFSPFLEKIGVQAFYNTHIVDLILPDSIKEIDESAFASCKNLETIKLPKNLIKLSKDMFECCKNLKNIVLPDSIEIIEAYVFFETKNLTNINIPKNLKTISTHAFNTSSIKSLTFNHDLEEIEFDLSYGDNIFTDTNIEKLIIDKSVKTINPAFFQFGGTQIKEIKYCGTKEQFENFKSNNENLFKVLSGIKKINFIEDSLEKEVLSCKDNKNRKGISKIFSIFER